MNYRNESDETLVMLTLAGEQRAYEALVTRHQRSVIASAGAITRNEFMAEDAAQDAFVTAWMKLNSLQDSRKFGAWVCRIAKNCALNILRRYRSFLPLEIAENIDFAGDNSQNPAELYVLSEESNEVNTGVERLPARVRQIIRMHYFDGLSVAEIADRMSISEGTVKWQLHDGRKRMRKELCAMNEKYGDTLTEKIMKKVEELKLWQIKNDKSGFEDIYREVLREVEELPESSQKSHALADVLMRGWWWLPGKKNDALYSRIVDAATEGKNEEVMRFIVNREISSLEGKALIEFIRDKQIPRLEEEGFVKVLGERWYALGYAYFREKMPELGEAAYAKAEAILSRDDPNRALIPYARKTEEMLSGELKDNPDKDYVMGATAEEYRYIDGELRYWNSESIGEGWLPTVDRDSLHLFRYSSICDGHFFSDVAVGESIVGSDGTTLTYLCDNAVADTPAGRFEGCSVWLSKYWKNSSKSVYKTYYKEGVGIVRFEHTADGITDTKVLKSYEIKGGRGLLPIFEGNRWEYDGEYPADTMETELSYTVEHADSDIVIISSWQFARRLKYDENSWLEMINQIRNDYCKEDGNRQYICDVYHAIDRAEALATTKMEKAHTRAAASVARRILETDPVFNPKYTATGHWNFFSKNGVRSKNGLLTISHNYRWSFEWKNTGYMDNAEDPILFNDILGILQDAANCIWSEEWRIGASPIVEYTNYSRDIRTEIVCEEGGTVTTKAGCFENCFKLSMNIGGMTGGWHYRGGKKVYYFAEGVGIVRTENEYCGGARTAVYELTSYEGVGKGYMPMADGLIRRYDALDTTDGFVGAAEYEYVADSEGDIVIFADRTGIRQVPPPITQYSTIQGEMIEDRLCDEGKWKEGQLQHSVNNFNLILHMLARPSRNRFNAKRSVELNGFYMRIMESLGENGEIPPAWYALYGWTALIKAAALFGNKEKEEGYRHLEIAAEYCKRVDGFKRGDLLDTGNEEVFGGVKLSFDNELIILPDGKKEPVGYSWRLNSKSKNLLYAVTTKKGWEWFNSVRDDERFKEFVKKVRQTVEETEK